MKIEVKTKGEKPFHIDVKEFNLDERLELNKHLFDFFKSKDGMTGPAVAIWKMATDLSDKEINEYSNAQWFDFVINLSNIVNKSKKK